MSGMSHAFSPYHNYRHLGSITSAKMAKFLEGGEIGGIPTPSPSSAKMGNFLEWGEIGGIPGTTPFFMNTTYTHQICLKVFLSPVSLGSQ